MQSLRLISEDHSNMWRLATTIDHVAEEIEGGAKVDPAFFNSVFDYIEQFVDRYHHPKEDHHLFRLLRLRSPKAAGILDPLQEEHRDGHQQLKTLRACAAQAAQDGRAAPEFVAALRAYTAGLKNHMRQEEKLVMPLAREALAPEDWAEIDRAFLDNEDPLFGDKAKAEFRELFHRIASLAPESIGLGGHTAGKLQPNAMPVQADVLLRVSNMESCYGRIKALKGISLEVRRGETVALVGANGAG